METLFIYLLKSSGLIAVFYLAYHFLVRKETFFDGNRWFLLAGLFTSLLLPLYFIKKIVFVERPKYSMADLIAYSQKTPVLITENNAVEAFDWIQFLCLGYILVAFLLVSKIVLSLISLYRMLYQQQVIKKEQFKLVNLNQNIAPFSFFNYIVVNPNLYSSEELQSILLHEKIHSQEKHSIDVLIAKTFCIVFWFNPFVWLYKKAIIQNLEYIADQKAMQQLEDKKSYQRALLKVVSNQNCLSITNNFYQSLIKKRIVMLNKNQSNKRNSLKYALIIPALIGFVLLFQIQTIAQEKEMSYSEMKQSKDSSNGIKINKNTTDTEMKIEAERLKNSTGTIVKFSKVKRNSNGEITAIKIDCKSKDGNKSSSHINSSEPIDPIVVFQTKNAIGIKTQDNRNTNIRLAQMDRLHSEEDDNNSEGDNGDEIYTYHYEYDEDFPVPPVAPVAPTAPAIAINISTFPNMPTPPTPPAGTPLNNEKEWKKFEKKMEEFEKKMEAIEPEIEAYAEKMANIDEQMKPFEKEMEAFEKKMEAFEKEMEIYAEKLESKMMEKREKAKAKK